MTIIINLFLAVIEGLGIIISPCILPVLPIILSVGMTGGKTRPYGIMIGFISAFCVFTLLSRFILYSLHIDLEILRNISLVLLAFFGIVMMSNYLSDKFTLFTQVFANFGEKLINKKMIMMVFGVGFLLVYLLD